MRSTRPLRSASRVSIGAALALSCAALAGAAGPREAAPPPWRAKVHPRVLDGVAQGPTEFILFLADQADPVGPGGVGGGKVARTRAVFELLRDHAARTQAPLVAVLDSLGVEYRSFWIANMLWVRGDAAALERLARDSAVLRVDANPKVRLEAPEPVESDPAAKSIAGIEWNVSKIGADVVWALGYLGTGAVVGAGDTGFQWQHPALRGHYRGWDGTQATHDYNWHDAIHSGGGICGPNRTEPCDDNSHGSHVMGIMVGDDGGGNQIGVAPGARWIGCRNMDQDVGTPATYTECFQWFVAPTNLAGQNPDPSRAPDVINNSWICPASEGCSESTLRMVVQNTRAAGIVVVASAGNTGPFCSSVNVPPAIYDESFTVGSTDSLDVVAPTSSRGPVTVDGSGRKKPDVSAPGVAVRSSVPFDIYKIFSGTSMAGPHVAGLVALLLSARPDLAGRVDEIEALVASSAVPLITPERCGGDTITSIPNNTYGWGRIDAPRLFSGDADADGVGNIADCAPVDPATWAAPGPARSLAIAPDRETLSWQAPADPGAATSRYDVVRSTSPGDLGSAACILAGATEPGATDPEIPADLFAYLVRTVNACGASLGHSSLGPRSVPACGS